LLLQQFLHASRTLWSTFYASVTSV